MKKKAAPGSSRPLPPAAVAEVDFALRFWPAPELATWVRDTFLLDTGLLYNEEHKHLIDADVCFLWASSGYTRRGVRVLGRCEEVRIMGEAWTKARQEQQMREWFGHVPEFLITIDGFHAASCSDVEFCALIEHELFHIGHAKDEFGAPKFRQDGRPRLGLRDHDVSEFVGVVARYGVGDAGAPLAQMIIAAAKGAQVAPIRVAQACGTCQLRAA